MSLIRTKNSKSTVPILPKGDNMSSIAQRLEIYFKNKFWNTKYSRTTAYAILLAVVCGIGAAIIYTAIHPSTIEMEEPQPDTDKGHRLAGAIVSGIGSLGVILFMCAFVLSHTAGKTFKNNMPLLLTYMAKVLLLFFMWVAFYIIPIINYVKYAWQPLRDAPPKDSSEYKVYQWFRGIMNVILIIIGLYCTLKIVGYFKKTDIGGERDDFIVAYVAVFMAMFGGAVNLANLFGFASDDDVLLST